MHVDLFITHQPFTKSTMEAQPSGPPLLARRFLTNLNNIFDFESSGRLIIYSAVVGVVAGLGAALFFYLLEQFQAFALGQVVGYYPPGAGTEAAIHPPAMPPLSWRVVAVPVLGGLVCGFLVYRFAPEAEGHGTDAMVRAFHRQRGFIRGRIPAIKGLASIVTIGTGGSAGREGPIAQIGAAFGSLLASRLKLSDWERRMLMLAGAAGGIGAIFRAPLGGALFVCEVLYASTAIEFSALVPAMVSSVVAYTVYSTIYGPGFAFTAPGNLRFHGGHELPFYLAFAIVCALAGFVYVRFFYGLREHVFRPLRIPNHVKPAIGALALGGAALYFPQVMAGGYGWIQQALDGQMEMRLMAELALLKIAVTSFTISSGGSGGVFAPSLFIGAMLGGAYGMICQRIFPEYVPQPEAYVLVGMGGFFAGVAKVPLTALLMVSEMSGSYALLVPLMLVSIINVAVLSSRVTLYEEQLPSLIDSPAHLGDFVVDVLARIRVRDVFDARRPVHQIPQDLPLPEIVQVVARAKSSYFPVVDSEGLMTGIFSLRDIRAVLEGNGAGGLVVAADLATFPVLTVTPDDDLHTALRLFTRKNIDELPVVRPETPRKVVGMLRRKDVIAAYDDQLAQLQHQHQT